jgi:dihydrofolate reductase
MINAIVAMGAKRVIGRKNGLLWPIPDDLKRFKELTMGHPVIMGRKTFDSILSTLKKPLPSRTNIIITRDPSFLSRQGLDIHRAALCIVGSLEEALEKAKKMPGGDEIFIIGGAQIYEQSLPFVERLYLTLVDSEEEGDAYFPAYEHLFTKKTSEESRQHNDLKYKWVTLEK